MNDPSQGMTPEQFSSFVSGVSARAAAHDPRAIRNREAMAQAAAAMHGDEAPVAELRDRSYEPPPMFRVFEVNVRGGKGSAWGLRHHTGWWHAQSYRTKERAEEVMFALIPMWMDRNETTLVAEFADARGEDESVEEWKARSGL